MDGGGAYGAGKASGRAFDVLAFVRKPQVILRAVSWVSRLSLSLSLCVCGPVVRRSAVESVYKCDTPRSDLYVASPYCLYRRRGRHRLRVSLSFDAAAITTALNSRCLYVV